MEVLFFAILGLLQGLCEFLPISSSGHLVLFSKIFGIDEALFVSILLHVATLLSIVVVYWKDVKEMFRHPFSERATMIYLGTIPTCLIVLLLMPLVDVAFQGKYLSICFLISAVILFCVDFFAKKKGKLSFKNAFWMGVAQGLAVFPGVSRSGATISAGLASGAERKDCAKFSFLMSIPVIILSLVMEIGKMVVKKEGISINIPGAIVAFLIAFVSGIFAIKLMEKLTEKLQLKWFAIYLLIISIMCIILL